MFTTLQVYEEHVPHIADSLPRYEKKTKPFVLTRSYCSSYQRYAAALTANNNSAWDYLQISYPLCSSIVVAEMSFCGAVVDRFTGNLTYELYQRWYQGVAWRPFFRAHTHQYYERRKLYLYAEDVQV
ncbi:Glycosyl hydrolases family 31 [Popillia japonica]|uniref:Glycosyl hydrolases family 31 n=1 Tax=Popillia japonica TaxID=7064 RepID=A0AAW1I6N5_POPJA